MKSFYKILSLRAPKGRGNLPQALDLWRLLRRLQLLAMTHRWVLIYPLLLFLSSSCQYFSSFDPNAAMEVKWKKVSPWIPDQSKYTVAFDLSRLAKTKFGSQMILEMKDMEVDTNAGIFVLTNNLTFIGGRFNKDRLLEKIKASLSKDKTSLSEKTFQDKIIYTDTKTRSSFVFLESYLLCQGKEKEIKNLIQQHFEKKIRGPVLDTSFPITGIFKYKSDIKLQAGGENELKVSALATFATKKDASAFADEMTGIKTIKTIQSVDEPWLADILDEISIEQTENVVKISTSFDIVGAKKLLRYFL